MHPYTTEEAVRREMRSARQDLSDDVKAAQAREERTKMAERAEGKYRADKLAEEAERKRARAERERLHPQVNNTVPMFIKEGMRPGEVGMCNRGSDWSTICH